MKTTGEFNCVYGSQHTKDTVYVYKHWYVVDGSVNVNRASNDTEFVNGIDVEEIEDVDTFTSSSQIISLDELIDAVDN